MPKKSKGPGRPALSKEKKRVVFSCRVLPETRATIKREARRGKVSTGEVLDATFVG